MSGDKARKGGATPEEVRLAQDAAGRAALREADVSRVRADLRMLRAARREHAGYESDAARSHAVAQKHLEHWAEKAKEADEERLRHAVAGDALDEDIAEKEHELVRLGDPGHLAADEAWVAFEEEEEGEGNTFEDDGGDAGSEIKAEGFEDIRY